MRKVKQKNSPPTRVTQALVPKQRAWMLDCDYWDKLSANEQKYLAQFHDEYYRADFRYAEPMHDTDGLRRERYNMQNENYRDVYARAYAAEKLFMGGVPSHDDPAASVLDCIPTPDHLETEEYKLAVEDLRKLVDIPKKKRNRSQRQRIAVLQEYIKSLSE